MPHSSGTPAGWGTPSAAAVGGHWLLADLSGVGKGAISSIASRVGYNVSIQTIEKLCRALAVGLHQMLEMMDDPPKSKPKRKSKAKGKKS